MRPRHHLALVCILALSFAGWLISGRGGKPAAGPSSTAAQNTAPTVRIAQPDPSHIALQQELEAQETRAYIEELKRLEVQRSQKVTATAENRQARASLQNDRQEVWSTFIRTNWHTYETLRKAVIDSPDHSAHCTLCDGRGLMNFCLLCEGDGQCPACQGTGKSSNGQLCPVCLGTAKCFLCFGKGRMPCPFCDDGVIYASLPLASATLPLSGTALSRPGTPKAANKPIVATSEAITSAPPVVAAPTHARPAEAGDSLLTHHQLIQLGAAFVLVCVIILTRISPWIADCFNRRSQSRTPDSVAGDVPQEVLAEEQAFSKFLVQLRNGPPFRSSPDPNQAADTIPSEGNFEAYFERAPALLVSLRILFSEISRTESRQQRHQHLRHMWQQATALKELSSFPELLPAWQLAATLEGLVCQLTQNSSLVTSSALRTAAAAVDLLESLSSSGLHADVMHDPPVRILVVDHSPIGRISAALTLKKLFADVEVVPDANGAFALLGERYCDAVFIDVEGSRVDEDDFCSKIHQASSNQTVPVVFVIRGSDFGSHTTPAAYDLVAKPLLSFEIALKATTLVLRHRLQRLVEKPGLALVGG